MKTAGGRLVAGLAIVFAAHAPLFAEVGIDASVVAPSGRWLAPAAQTASFRPVIKSTPQMATRMTEVAETPAEAKAAAEKLTWLELSQRPELWPATVTVRVAMDFQGGVSVRAGQPAKLLQIKPQEADLATLDGKLNFAADPDETDALAVARDGYAKLTPRQRKLTFGSLISSKELWPYKVKLTQSFDFGNGKGVRAGDEVTVMDFQAGRLTVKSEVLNGAFQVVPQATDIMEQARKFVEDESAGPRLVAVQKAADDEKRAADERVRARGRVVAELDGRLVSSVTDKPQPLDEAALPRYLVFFRGSTTCPITRGFMPSMLKFYQQEKPKHPEFEVVWIEADSPEDTGKFAREEGFSWRAVEYDSTPYVPTVNNMIDGKLPQLIVMDRDGKVLINGIQNDVPAALNQLAALLK